MILAEKYTLMDGLELRTQKKLNSWFLTKNLKIHTGEKAFPTNGANQTVHVYVEEWT